MKYIPNTITCLNLTSGFAAVIFAASGDILTASWLILAAMIFDFFDGFSARLLKAYSEIGKELDSLADVVSFGVAPGVIIFRMLSISVSGTGSVNIMAGGGITILIILITALMPVAAALRLAIFNLDETQSTSFKGLPTPANAIAVISLAIASHYSSSALYTSFSSSLPALAAYTAVLSLLMITRIPLLSLKVSDLKWKGNEGRFIMIGLIVISFVILGIDAAPMIIPIYILSSLLSLLF